MKLREREPIRNFFGAMTVLTEADTQRDPQLYPRIVQAWNFLKKYMANSRRFDWGTKAACRASMRDVQSAAEDFGIWTGINLAAGLAALVTLMNIPHRKQDTVLKQMVFINSSAIHGDLCIPMHTYAYYADVRL